MKTSTIANNSRNRVKKIFRKIMVAVLWLAVWQLIFMAVKQEILIVSPAQVFFRLVVLVREKSFWIITATSLIRILEGYLASIAVGTVLAVVTALIPIAYDFFYPVISIIKATPVASFVLLALVWIKTDFVPGFMSFLMVMPIIWANVYEGIFGTDEKLLEMGRVFGLSKSRIINKIYFPSVIPYFMAGCTTGLGLAWKAGIAAEVLSIPKRGIGTQLYNAKIYLDTTDLFAWTVVIIILSVILEKIFITLMNKTVVKFNILKNGQKEQQGGLSDAD